MFSDVIEAPPAADEPIHCTFCTYQMGTFYQCILPFRHSGMHQNGIGETF